MKAVLIGALLAVSAYITAPAHAGVMTYEASNAYPNHGLWLAPVRNQLGLGNNYRFSVESGQFIYDTNSGDASLQITTFNADNRQADVTLLLNRRGVGTAGEGTNGPQHSNWSIRNNTSITDLWTYFDLSAGSVRLYAADSSSFGTGFDSSFDSGMGSGLFQDILITTFPNPEDRKPAQLGAGGNWRDMEYGFSMWFDCTNIPGKSANSHCGDVNVNLTKVPEPGTLGLFGLAAAGLLLRRRTMNSATH